MHTIFTKKQRAVSLRLAIFLIALIGSPCIFFADRPSVAELSSKTRRFIKHAHRQLVGNNGKIKKALFSPDDGIREVILGLIAAETKAIYVASYVITDKLITEALIEAHQRKVKVEVVTCRSGAKDTWSKVDQLQEAGIPVYIYPSGYTRSIMHNKFIVFQKTLGRMVLATGSFNMTRSASQTNQENMLFLDDGDLSKQYLQRFEYLKTLSVALRDINPVH